MRPFGLASLLGLSIVGGTLTLAPPARAVNTIWRNFGSTAASGPMCLGTTWSTEGSTLVIHHCGTQRNGPNWDMGNYPFGSVYWTFTFPPIDSLEVSALNDSMSNGTPVILHQFDRGTTEQWVPYFFIHDINGALCYIFFNGKDTSKVMGVSAGIMTDARPIIIWDFLGHPDQAWCAYTRDQNGNFIPEVPPPFPCAGVGCSH
jgi:hypothetical protein